MYFHLKKKIRFSFIQLDSFIFSYLEMFSLFILFNLLKFCGQ